MRYLVALAAALLLNAAANLMMKFGMHQISQTGPWLKAGPLAAAAAIVRTPILILGVACFAANLLCYMYALQKLPISIAYPIMVTAGFAIIVVVAGLYLHERLVVSQWLGVVLILVGVWLVASRAAAQLR
jgi:multidrug transporter EmrE-like cation transporter